MREAAPAFDDVPVRRCKLHLACPCSRSRTVGVQRSDSSVFTRCSVNTALRTSAGRGAALLLSCSSVDVGHIGLSSCKSATPPLAGSSTLVLLRHHAFCPQYQYAHCTASCTAGLACWSSSCSLCIRGKFTNERTTPDSWEARPLSCSSLAHSSALASSEKAAAVPR